MHLQVGLTVLDAGAGQGAGVDILQVNAVVDRRGIGDHPRELASESIAIPGSDAGMMHRDTHREAITP